MSDMTIEVDVVELAQAIFEVEAYPEAEKIAEGVHEDVQRVLEIMWDRTKPDMRARAEEKATTLMSLLAANAE